MGVVVSALFGFGKDIHNLSGDKHRFIETSDETQIKYHSKEDDNFNDRMKSFLYFIENHKDKDIYLSSNDFKFLRHLILEYFSVNKQVKDDFDRHFIPLPESKP